MLVCEIKTKSAAHVAWMDLRVISAYIYLQEDTIRWQINHAAIAYIGHNNWKPC